VKKYPDISELIKQKEEHRRKMAALPFEKKVEIAFALSARHKFIKSGRLARGNGNSNPRKTK
jgi:hypothetical protein